MTQSKVFLLDVAKDIRVQRLVKDYGAADKQEFLEAMTGITKRLGGQHFLAAKEKLLSDDMASCIEILLTYYDKAYNSGISKKQPRVKSVMPWDGDDANVLARQLIEQTH
jgi:tRNA 2-selenouridine synthase